MSFPSSFVFRFAVLRWPHAVAAGLLAATSLCRGASAPRETQSDALLEVVPSPYERALRNPLKGITARNLGEHKWATLAHHYIAWDEIESSAADGVDKIRAFCDNKWHGLPERNVKVIPRVYLDYPGQARKHWPKDLRSDDYESAEFGQRLVRLVEKLGAAWDEDPRVAFVELGVFGKWGEHHSPEPSAAVQTLAADAFKKAFPHKLISVRQVWAHFPTGDFGEYWDSFAHYDQMRDNGAAIAGLNDARRLYEKQYVGGEVAYDWGHWKIQPGASPTETLAVREHRDFMLNTIRWLHATQIRWIGDYDFSNSQAELGAEEVQKALGYRFVLERARFSRSFGQSHPLRVELEIKNEGSAPFYYDWPVEISLLAMDTRQVVWRGTFEKVDIRTWLPGAGWTSPAWRKATNQEEAFWPDAGECRWSKPAEAVRIAGMFSPPVPSGRYYLAVAVVDPAGSEPSLRFATANYFTGGRHPLGIVGVGGADGGPLPTDLVFDDPQRDSSLHYTVANRAQIAATSGDAATR